MSRHEPVGVKPASGAERGTRGGAIVGALLDLAGVFVFVGIGRSVHDHGVSVTGMASTAWPFLTGLGLGWLATRAWRRWADLLPVGLGVWVSTVVIGMILRQVSGQGIAAAFVGVAFGFLGVVMLGWRALWLGASIRRRPTQ